jgi:hypothetical protein
MKIVLRPCFLQKKRFAIKTASESNSATICTTQIGAEGDNLQSRYTKKTLESDNADR